MAVMTPMLARARLLCLVTAVALAIAGCTRGGGQSANAGGQSGPTGSYGILTGGITRGPMFPVSRAGAPPSPVPVAGAELRIFDLKGVLVATARTDGGGLYRVSLPSGNYRVVRGAGFSGAARNLPAIVAVSPGGQTRLDIWVDTGIRVPGGPAATR
jgi:hypothetical protein